MSNPSGGIFIAFDPCTATVAASILPGAKIIACNDGAPGAFTIEQMAESIISTLVDSGGNPLAPGSVVPTAADVAAAIAAAIAAIPGDNFLSSAAYNPVTNILTFTMSDLSTIDVDLTALLADAIAPSTDLGNVFILGTDGQPYVPFAAWMAAPLVP